MMTTTIKQDGRMRVKDPSIPVYIPSSPVVWRYIVMGNALIRYIAGRIKETREYVPRDQWCASSYYNAGRDETPPTPDGYEYAFHSSVPGQRTRRDFYVKVGA